VLVPIGVTGDIAGVLPAADASHEAVVATFVLCTVPDQNAALADIRRI
jgi:hypothetical protein